ncbi:MAG: hypothetical protein WC358_10440, partial [Ignavibacteria bacterium]
LLLFTLSVQSYSKHLDCSVSSDSTQNELNGEIQSKKGNTIKVSINSAESLPDVSATGTLSKYFEEEIFGMNTHGYIDIGEVEVIGITESEVIFTLVKELSKIKINGKKENHFKKGNIVKFTW